MTTKARLHHARISVSDNCCHQTNQNCDKSVSETVGDKRINQKSTLPNMATVIAVTKLIKSANLYRYTTNNQEVRSIANLYSYTTNNQEVRSTASLTPLNTIPTNNISFVQRLWNFISAAGISAGLQQHRWANKVPGSQHSDAHRPVSYTHLRAHET